MASQEEKLKFIDRLGKQLLQYKKEGCIIIDRRGNIAINIDQIGFKREFGLCIDDIVYYSKETDIDVPLSKLKEMASNFKIVRPEHIISISNF